MKTTTIVITSLSIGLLGLMGVNRLVSAAPSGNPATIQAQTQAPEKEADDRETNDDAKEKQEAKQLQALAKITPQQAEKAAIAFQPGKLGSIELESDDGSLVYAVAIGKKEVKVDAGNGKVLYVEEDSKVEKDDASRPRSSIQVAEPKDGDSDGETKDDNR
jgi:hypothetical protein